MKRPFKTLTRPLLRLPALAALATLAGCAMVSPYDHLALEPQRPADESGRAPPGLRLAGDAEEGLRAADGMRLTYFRNLKSTSVVRSLTGGTAAAITGWALYNATRTTDAGTEAVKNRSAALAASLGSLYALRELFVNPRQEAVHAAGYRSLTCLMLQSAPLLMTESDGTPGTPPAGDFDRLERNLARLSDTIDLTWAEVGHLTAAIDIANAYAAGKGGKNAKPPVAKHVADARKALERAMTTLSDGKTLERTVRNAGRDIRNRAGLIVAAVNEQVQAAQPQLRGGVETFNDAHAIAESVLNLGTDSAADAADAAADPPDGAVGSQSTLGAPWWRDGVWLAGPMSAAAERIDFVFARQTARAAPRRAAAATPAAPASASAPKADAAADDAQRMREIEADVARLGGARCDGGGTSPSCALHAARLTEALYAARRPVLQELQNFRRRTRAVLQVPECAELAPLRLVPNDVLVVQAGASATYLVTQRDPGNPIVVLQGAQEGATSATGAKLTFTAVEGSTPSRFKAVVDVGAQAPRRTLRIVASDSTGKAYLSVPIVVGGGVAKAAAADKPKAENPIPPASAASR